MRGDLLFYSPRGNVFDQLVERLVCRVTHGPFCHVAIDLGDGTKVEATTRGIVHVPTDGKEAARFSLAPRSVPSHLEAALQWALKQVGQRYGWEDIVDQGLKLLGFHFFIGIRYQYDCSDLAARVCRMSDGLDLDTVPDLHLITPNDLARLAGVIK
jgi:uncharacterized protein YycO